MIFKHITLLACKVARGENLTLKFQHYLVNSFFVVTYQYLVLQQIVYIKRNPCAKPLLEEAQIEGSL